MSLMRQKRTSYMMVSDRLKKKIIFIIQCLDVQEMRGRKV